MLLLSNSIKLSPCLSGDQQTCVLRSGRSTSVDSVFNDFLAVS